jgi:hypothetical protein
MKRINNAVCGKLAAGLSMALSAVLAPEAGAGSINLPIGTQVSVTNSAANPVPVTVTGSVGVSGTSNVNVVNTPSVNVANGSLPVYATDNPAFLPYTSTGAPGGSCASPGIYLPLNSVPNGQTLVVESVDLALFVPTGYVPQVVLITTAPAGSGQVNVFHSIPLVLQGTDGTHNYYAANQSLRDYTGSPAQMALELVPANSVSGTPNVCMTYYSVSGHLVNTP